MTTRASKQPKTGPEITDLDGDGRRYALSVDGLIRFTGSREDCENRLRLLAPASTRDAQNWHLGRALGALVLAALVGFVVPRGTEAASTINTTLPVQGSPYNAAPIRQNFGAAANDIAALQGMNAGASAPSAPVLGTLWLETPVAETNYLLHIWNSRLNAWVQIATLDSLNGLWITNVGGGLPATLLTDDTVDLGSVPNAVITVTGAGPVYSLGSTAPPGVVKIVIFSGATQLIYNATSLILPGAADLTTAAGDIAIFTSLATGNWQGLYFQGAASIVAQGGTGRTSLTDHAVLLGAGTSPVNFAVPGTAGYPLLSNGASADPAFGQLDLNGVGTTGTLTVDRGGTELAALTAHSLIIGNGTNPPNLLTPGTAALALVSNGPTLDPSYQLLEVAGGGTGTAILALYSMVAGGGTGPLTGISPSTAGYPLVSTGATAYPAFAQLNLAGGGVTGVLPLANLPFTIPTASLLGGIGTDFVGITLDSTLTLPATTLGVNPNLSLSTLAVSGASTLGTVTASNIGASGNLSVTGTSTLTGNVLVAGGLTVDGEFTTGFANVTFGGAVLMGDDLHVDGTSQFDSTVNMSSQLNVNGNIVGLMALTVSGNVFMDGLGADPGGNQPICINTISGQLFIGAGGVCPP